MCPFINGRGSATTKTSKNSFVYFSEANIACPSETSIRPRGRLWSNFKGFCLVTIRYFLTSFARGESAQHFETVPGWMRPMAAEISGGKSRQTRHVDIPQSDVTRNALAAIQSTKTSPNEHQSTADMLTNRLVCNSSAPGE